MTYSDDPDKLEVYALEINLRHGGTTHPMMTMKLLVNGGLDEQVCVLSWGCMCVCVRVVVCVHVCVRVCVGVGLCAQHIP